MKTIPEESRLFQPIVQELPLGKVASCCLSSSSQSQVIQAEGFGVSLEAAMHGTWNAVRIETNIGTLTKLISQQKNKENILHVEAIREPRL